MESGRIFFDPSACHGNMLFLGNDNNVFRGQRTLMSMEEASKKRPFFSSPDDLFYDEYYDEQLSEKKRRLSPEQVHQLEKSFEAENKLEPERKSQLAKKLGLQPRQVAVWFQNRRARWKTKQLERDFDILKASYDSLLSKYDSVLHENDNLKSQVASLTDKLQVQPKEVIITQPSEKNPDSVVAEDIVDIPVKVEDRLSSVSVRSAVVDEEDSPQLVDSGDSYFPGDDYARYDVRDGINSEDDDGSIIGQGCYFSSNLFSAAEQEQHEGEALGWWVWS